MQCTNPCPLCPQWRPRKRIPAKGQVRIAPESGRVRCTSSCPLWANSGRRRRFLFTRGLANRFGDDPCPIAPFTGLIALLACLVYLLSGPMAVGADILAGARRAGFWISPQICDVLVPSATLLTLFAIRLN